MEKQYNWLIKANLVSLIFIFLLHLTLGGGGVLLEQLFFVLFVIFGFGVFWLGGINLAEILRIFGPRKFDFLEMLAIGSGLALFLVPVLNLIVYALIGKISFLTIFFVYLAIFILLFIIVKIKKNG